MRTRHSTWTSLALIACASPAWTTPIQAQIKPPAGGRQAQVLPEHLRNQGSEITRFERVRLAVPESPLAFERVELPFEGQWLSLDLHLRSVRAYEFQVLAQREDGSYEEVDAGAPTTFRGLVPELKGAVVAGSFLASGLEAQILLEDGRTIAIEPDYEGFLRGDRQSYLVYDLQAAYAPPWQCDGPVVVPTSESGHEQLGTGCGGPHCRAELALDLDYVYYTSSSSDVGLATARAENIVNIANVQYERQVGIRHEITTVIVRTSLASEPPGYGASTGTGDFLTAMRDWWRANHAGIARDVAHAITGRHTGGTAYNYSPGNGVICDSLTTGFGFGVSGSALEPYVRSIANVVAHELGHNWGADHCTCVSPPYTMNPSYPPCPLRFHNTETVPEILSERNSVSCLTPGVVGDDFEDALVMSSGILLGSTVGATVDGTASCGSSASTPDVWYRYTPASSGAFVISTCGAPTSYDTVLSLHGWNGTVFTELACNDDNCGVSSRIFWDGVAGETYYVRVSGFNGSTGTFELASLGPPDFVPNDAWTNAIEIGPGFQVGNTTAATLDSGTEHCGFSNGAHDVWYLYRAFTTDVVTADLCASDFDTILSVYNLSVGPPTDPASLVVCNDDWCGLQSRVEWTPFTDVTYLIRISGFDGAFGSYRLGLSGPDARNSRCDTSPAREIGQGAYWISLGSAYTIDGDSTCGPFAEQPARWYKIDGTYPGTYTVRTCGTNDLLGVDRGVDTVLSIHSGCPGTGANELDCSDDFGACSGERGAIRDSQVSAFSPGGMTFRVRLSPFAAGNGDLVRLESSFVPANDACSSPIPITVGTYQGTLRGATQDGETICGLTDDSPDVWYSFHAQVSGRLFLNTCGTHDLPGVDEGMDTVLSVHQNGCPADSSTTIICNDDAVVPCAFDQGTLRDSALDLMVVEGRTVLIRVANYNNGLVGDFVLNVDFRPNGAKVPR